MILVKTKPPLVMNKHGLILICFLICQHYLYAQDDAIFTDRPGQTDAVYTMGKGYFQIESGFFYGTDEGAGNKITASTTPNLMIKYGVIDRVEVKLFLDVKHEKNEDKIAGTKSKNSGLAPIRLATKVFLIEGDGWMPAASITGILSLPNTGNNAFQHKDLNPSIRLQMENSISDHLSLNYSIGGDWDFDNNNSQGVYTIVLGNSFSDKLGGWAELYGTFNNGNEFATDFGLAYLLTDYLQLDTSLGIGLNDAATDFFFNLGISWKTSLLNK